MIRGDTILFVYAVVGLALGVVVGYYWQSWFGSRKGEKA